MIDKKVTVSQIAKYAGVSPATVSRVLNHRDQVKEDTILKVEEAMNALNFTPDASSQEASYANTNLLINQPLLRRSSSRSSGFCQSR